MKKKINLPQTSNCSETKTFYSCIASRAKCSKNCTPFLLQDYSTLDGSNGTLPFCEGADEINCTTEYGLVYYDSYHKCPNACIQKSYSGDVTTVGDSAVSLKDTETGFAILFASKDVHEQKETLAYGIPDVIGSVGGTLGLFVGFSFYGYVTIPLQKFLRKG